MNMNGNNGLLLPSKGDMNQNLESECSFNSTIQKASRIIQPPQQESSRSAVTSFTRVSSEEGGLMGETNIWSTAVNLQVETEVKNESASSYIRRRRTVFEFRKDPLRRQMKHTAETPYYCDQCPFKCNRQVNFKLHLMTKIHTKTRGKANSMVKAAALKDLKRNVKAKAKLKRISVARHQGAVRGATSEEWKLIPPPENRSQNHFITDLDVANPFPVTTLSYSNAAEIEMSILNRPECHETGENGLKNEQSTYFLKSQTLQTDMGYVNPAFDDSESLRSASTNAAVHENTIIAERDSEDYVIDVNGNDLAADTASGTPDDQGVNPATRNIPGQTATDENKTVAFYIFFVVCIYILFWLLM
ncbi:unnamed protein product [Orchesella dallaii]|uniref:C2H2-type domain-containing protein n=1 Tax=Orchesella dallaii TaxID=48710 RepID=A0ABP1PU82_9HEXA